jgi:serine/threonine protein kinase
VPFLVMEYLRGEDMEHLAKRRGPLPPNEVVLLLSQAARGLDKAHALGIVHRDLKPENLFVTQREDGTPCVKILDFGIAKMTGSADVKDAGRLTATGQIFGTPLYMSPEQAMAEGDKICPQTDVWAFGLIAHRLLTGDEFWTAETLTHLVAQIAFEPIPRPSEKGCTLGSAYDEWFRRTVCRKIENRYKTTGEAATALATALRVTDSPSQLAKLPVSVRISTTSPLVDEHDVLGATSAAEGMTAPDNSNRTPPPLGRTQFDAETAKAARPKALGFIAAGAGAVVIGAILAWRLTAPPEVAATGPASSNPPGVEPPSTAQLRPAGTAPAIPPVVTPSSADISVTTEPAPAGTVAPVKPAVGGTGAVAKSTTAASSKPSAAPSTTPTTAPPPEPTATAPKDPLGTRR